jgi:hypothetical protein
VIAGRWPGNIVPGTDEIFIYGAAGVVETQLNGVTGITLGPNTTQAVFRIPDFGLPWQVARYLLSLQGNIPPGTVKLRVSLDGGVTFQSVTRDQATTIAASSIPGSRVLEVTLLSAGSAVPILTKTIEHFEQTGGSSGLTEVVIRVDCPASQKWWMLGRDGLVTVATQVSTNTTSKALLIRTNHIGTVAPAIRRFISRRDATISFRGVKAGGVDPAFLHELAVVPNHVTARGIDAAGKFYDIPEPAFSLDSNLIVSGLAANGDKYEVEVRVGYSYIVQFFSI